MTWSYSVTVKFETRMDASRFHAAVLEMGLNAELPFPLQANARPQANANDSYVLAMPNPFGDAPDSPKPATNAAEPVTPMIDGDVLPMPNPFDGMPVTNVKPNRPSANNNESTVAADGTLRMPGQW